jgi:hypothetical protein
MGLRDIYLWLLYAITVTFCVVFFALKSRKREWFHRWLWSFLAIAGLTAALVLLIVKIKQINALEAFIYVASLFLLGLATFALLGPPKQHKPLRNLMLLLVATILASVLGGLLGLRGRYWLGLVVVVAAFIVKKVVVRPRLKKLRAELNNTHTRAHQT